MQELIILVNLWCTKIAPTEISHCTEYLTECIWDGETTNWCKKDYILLKREEMYERD